MSERRTDGGRSIERSNPRLVEVWAPYMEWAKGHPRPRFDLCGSNLPACTIDDLPGAREALAPNGDNDHGYRPLIEAIAAHHGTGVERVAPASGASGANFLALAALVGPGDEVLVERPAYDPLLGAARLLGATVSRFERRFEDGFAVDPERIDAALTPKTRLVVITSPHNPSGAVVGGEELDAIAELAARRGVHVLVDEVYLDTISPRPQAAANRSDRLLSTGSLTKAYGLAGLRCGWVLAAPEVAAAVRRVRGAVEAIGAYPAEVLARIAFANIEALVARARAILEPNGAALAAFVASRPELEWVPPAGGTVAFPRLSGHRDAGPFIDMLLAEHETSVVPGRFFEAPAHFRIAFGGVEAGVLRGGLARIGEALDRFRG
jgi:hypothetical protein